MNAGRNLLMESWRNSDILTERLTILQDDITVFLINNYVIKVKLIIKNIWEEHRGRVGGAKIFSKFNVFIEVSCFLRKIICQNVTRDYIHHLLINFLPKLFKLIRGIYCILKVWVLRTNCRVTIKLTFKDIWKALERVIVLQKTNSWAKAKFL